MTSPQKKTRSEIDDYEIEMIPISKQKGFEVYKIQSKGRVGLQEMTPLQAVGYRLAFAVLILISFLLIIAVSDISSNAPQFPELSNLELTSEELDRLQQISEILTAANMLLTERVDQILTFVAASLLPLLSAVIGFLFGARTRHDDVI